MKYSSVREHYIYSTSNILRRKQKRMPNVVSSSPRQRRQNCSVHGWMCCAGIKCECAHRSKGAQRTSS